MATEAPFKVLQRVADTINDSVEKAFSPKFTNKLGKKAGLQLVKRTRLGFGVRASTGNKFRLKPLSASYKDVRRGKLRFYTNKKTKQIFTVGKSTPAKSSSPAKRSKSSKPKTDAKKRVKKTAKRQPRLKNLSQNTSPGKSNLTATGGLLNAVRGYGRKAKIIIEINDKRHGPDLFGDPVDISNAELARVHQNGRTIRHPSGVNIKIPKRRFFDLSTAEKRGVIRQVRQFILKLTRARLG